MHELERSLSELIIWINQQGWSPATSTNYSFRAPKKAELCYVSRSGVDKSAFQEDDFILMTLNGQVDKEYEHLKPSAETAIHLMLYQQTDCGVVLHTHSMADTLLSRIKAASGGISLSHYELLKGLRNIETHEAEIEVPIFPNSQDIEQLSMDILSRLKTNPQIQGILIESHGFYTWGRSLSEAKRHLEVFQFLFECELKLLSLK